MRKSFITLSSLALIVFVFGSYIIVAQSAVTGNWTAKVQEKQPDRIQLSFERRTEKGGHNQQGSGFAFSDLQGLTPDQAQNGRVNFSLVREAGTIECEGTFADGRGAGTFVFTPNAGYVSAMKARGFDFEKFSSKGNGTIEDRLFAAATINVTTALADDLNSANFSPLDVDDLFKAAIFKIDSRFMAEMKATGFPNLAMEDLVKARIFKIDADYVRQVRDMGFDKLDFEGLVKFRIFKVTPEYLSDMRNEGLANLPAEDVVKFRIFKIDAAYIREARAQDPNISVDDLVKKKIGVWTK